MSSTRVIQRLFQWNLDNLEERERKKQKTKKKSYDEIEQSLDSFFHGSYKVSIVNWDVSFHKLKLNILCTTFIPVNDQNLHCT